MVPGSATILVANFQALDPGTGHQATSAEALHGSLTQDSKGSRLNTVAKYILSISTLSHCVHPQAPFTTQREEYELRISPLLDTSVLAHPPFETVRWCLTLPRPENSSLAAVLKQNTGIPSTCDHAHLPSVPRRPPSYVSSHLSGFVSALSSRL